mgnify:FL=1
MKNKMNKIIEAIKTKRWVHYLIIVIIGLLISIPFLLVQLYLSDDGKYHLLRLIGLDNSMEYGSFPFLVFPFFCKNWGYSMMTFYPQLVTYIPYVLGLISGAFSTGLKIFASLTVVFSGIFMYNLVNEVTKKKGVAFLSAILYMIFPYRFECLFNRFAIGEFTAFVFIPIVFQGLYNLLQGDKKRHYYIAIGATGLLLTHTISTVYTALFCLIFVLFNLKAFFNKEVIKKCLINIVFILLVSAMFIIPMLEFKFTAEYAILEPDVMKTNAENVYTKTIKPSQFLKDIGEDNGVSFVVGIPFITMILLGILAFRKIDKEHKDFYISFLLLGVISIIMCTYLFPWRFMPDILCTLQYPWRLLGFAFFFFAPVCAMNVYYLLNSINKKWLKAIAWLLAIAIIAGFTVMELNQYPTNDTSLDAKYEGKNKENPQIDYFAINRDNMPKKALYNQFGYLETRKDNTEVISGNVNIVSENKEALHLEIEIENAKKDTKLELPYLFYPGYTITLEYNGKATKIDYYESEYGFVAINLPEDIETGKITVDYTATVLEKTAYAISAISIVGFIVYVICFRKKWKKEELLNLPKEKIV